MLKRGMFVFVVTGSVIIAIILGLISLAISLPIWIVTGKEILAYFTEHMEDWFSKIEQWGYSLKKD